MLLTDDNFCIMYDPFASEGMRSPETEHRNNNECVKSHSINDLPDEVIEFVLSFVPPYKDLHDCMLVCKRWRENVLSKLNSYYFRCCFYLSPISHNKQKKKTAFCIKHTSLLKVIIN